MKSKKINASAKAASDVLNLSSALDLRAPAEGQTIPTFQMSAYTGASMRVEGYDIPVVVNLNGIEGIDKPRPIFRNHDSDKVVGHTTRMAIEGGQLVVEGIVSGAGVDAAEVIQASKNGFPWQASIGARPLQRRRYGAGETVRVNNQDFQGPILVVAKSRIGEISFVPLGADENTSARIAASARQESPMFEQWLKARGFDVDALTDPQRASLEAMFNAETAATVKAKQKPVDGDVTANADLETIFAAQRKKEERAQKISAITAEALRNTPNQLQDIEAMSRLALANDWDVREYELQLLKATRAKVNININTPRDEGLTNDVIEAAICLAGGLTNPEKSFSEQTLDAASKRWRHGLGLGELLMLFARKNGHDALSARDVSPMLRAAFAEGSMIRAAGFSTLSLPGILSNVANKFLKLGFDSVESTWRAIAAVRPVRDFKQVTSYSLTGDFTYVEIAPGGEIEHGEVGEESYTNQAKSYGRMFAIDRRDIINDDLNALTQVPKRLGRGGALKFNDVFWAEFMDNASFFSSGNANYLTGVTVGTNDSRLNIEGLTRAETAFYNQTDPDGKPLGLMPEILLVPNALNTTAANLMNSVEQRDTTASTNIVTGNPHAGKFTVVRSSYLSNSTITGFSVVAHYLLANPNNMATIEAAFLNGVETPTVESADADFNTLGIQMRGYHDFGVNKQEYRAGVKSKGAA